MSGDIHVACGALTGRIFAGPLTKDGSTWAHKTDVTEQAIHAVVEHIRRTHGDTCTLRGQGKTITINIKEDQ